MLSRSFLQKMVILCLVVSVAFLGVLAWMKASENLTKQDRLTENISEIARIDEVLTSSALLAATTGETTYRVRYYSHVDELDRLLRTTLELFENRIARDRISEVEAANAVLVYLETLALDETEKGPSPKAYATLTSEEYRFNKDRYARGVELGLAELHKSASRQVGLMRLAFWGFAISFVAMMCFSLKSFWGSKIERIERKTQDAKLEAIRAMLNTFMDLQNNLLNNMVYFRTKAVHNLPFDQEEISLIDREIKSAKEKLAAITETEFAETRDLGGIVVVSNGDEPDQYGRPANANVA